MAQHMMAILVLISVLLTMANSLSVLGIGDSISVGFNAMAFNISSTDDANFPLDMLDPRACGQNNPGRAWGAVIDDTFDGIQSYAELVGSGMTSNLANSGNPNATVLNGFVLQAIQASEFITDNNLNQSTTRVLIFMGHQDMCTSQIEKTSTTCPSTDQDPNNYCRTTTQAFEREFRKGLDALVSFDQMEIIVLAPFRMSQICNFAQIGKTAASAAYGSISGSSCQDFWSRAQSSALPFGNGPCASLTEDCSDQRIDDAYQTQLKYLAVMRTVILSYTQLSPGDLSPTGALVGNFSITLNEAPWNYRFDQGDISACDCFHPSRGLQQKLANLNTFDCTADSKCCNGANPATCGQVSAGWATIPSLFVGLALLFFTTL